MKLFHVMTMSEMIILSLVMLRAYSPCAQEESELNQVQCVRSFFRAVLFSEATSIEQDMYMNERMNGLVITQYLVNKKTAVWVSDQQGTVVRYRQKNRECASSSQIQSISPSEAFLAALPIIMYHGLPQEQTHYDIVRGNDGPGIGDRWTVSYSGFNIDGVPCVGRYIIISICADTGMVLSFSYCCPILPEPLGASTILKAEAVSRAKKWLDEAAIAKRYKWSGHIDNVSITKVRRVIIAVDDITYKDNSGTSLEGKAYYCWEVPLLLEEVGKPPYAGPVIFVRMDTGDVLGIR